MPAWSPDHLFPLLESSVIGRHLLAAEDSEHVRALLDLPKIAALPWTAERDIGPTIQKAYDDGAEGVRLASGHTYVWNTPVFLDRDEVLRGFVIEGSGATVTLGTGLPTTDWSRDSATRFAIFSNTKRAALAGGRVTVSSHTRATGTQVGAVRPLTVRNLVIDGEGRNAGFSFGNRSAVTFDEVILWRARVGATWVGYSDGNTFRSCYSRAGSTPPQQTLIEQVAPGDGILIAGGKADTPTTFARLRGCRGAVIQAVVTTRMSFEDCTGIVVQGAHLEGQSSKTPMVTVRNSQVTFTGSTFYETYDEQVGCIVIDDESELTASTVSLQDCTSMQLITPEQRNTTFSPIVIFAATQVGTTLTTRGLQGRHATTDLPGRWRTTAQPTFGAGTSKQLTKTLASPAALAAIAAIAAIAAGDFALRRVSGSWSITGSSGPIISKRMAPPTLRALPSRMKNAGTRPEGAKRSYVAAVLDATGRYSKHSSVLTATASGGVISIEVALPTAAAALVLWRSRGDVLAAPDGQATLPAQAGVVHLLDTRDHVGGTPWQQPNE